MSAEPIDPDVVCPFCDSTNVERLSRFGTEISKQGYFCNACRSPFERIKYDGRRPETGE